MKNLILPLAAVALMGACAPYPPNPAPPTVTPPSDSEPQTLTDEEQRQLQENRDRLERERRERESAGGNNATTPPVKPKYPTAAAVPGKPGFVFNPYTHNIVDVKGIGSGKLVRDPEDNDPTHKFRVP
ncbi:MAG: hypothetical protein AB8F34_04710 [Akkermansiaceae bacterium]